MHVVVPELRVADVIFNTSILLDALQQAAAEAYQPQLVLFPELCLTGGTCGDLFFQPLLREKALESLARLQEAAQQLYGEAPLYTRLGSRGPEHAKVFEIGLKLPNGTEFVATGSSCKKAEQNAAQQALAMLEETKNNPK